MTASTPASVLMMLRLPSLLGPPVAIGTAIPNSPTAAHPILLQGPGTLKLILPRHGSLLECKRSKRPRMHRPIRPRCNRPDCSCYLGGSDCRFYTADSPDYFSR